MCRVTILLKDDKTIVDTVKSKFKENAIKSTEWLAIDRFAVEPEELFTVECILEDLDIVYSVVQP